MNYRLKSKPIHEYRLTMIVIGLFFVVLSSIAYFFGGALRSATTTVARPVWLARDYVLDLGGSWIKHIGLTSSLIAENKELTLQLQTLTLKEIDYDVLLKENQELKELLGRSDVRDRVFARVLSKPPRSPYDTLVIDAGTSHGVKQGDKAYLSGNVIIGIVTHVTSKTALVTLFSHGEGLGYDLVLERTGTSYTIIGKGGGTMIIEAPKEADIKWGDTFVYPSLSPSVVGSVYYIDTNSQSSFKTVFLKFPGNVFSAKWIFIEKST